MFDSQPLSPLLDSMTDMAGQVSIDLPTLMALIAGGGAPIPAMPSGSPTPFPPPPLGMGMQSQIPTPPSNLEMMQQQAMMPPQMPMSSMDGSESLGVPGPQIGASMARLRPGQGRR